MPELPEVETVCRSLAKQLSRRTLLAVDVRQPRLRQWVDEDQLRERIGGQKIVRLSRRAKYLLAHCSNRSVLILHLGMTGQLLVLPATVPLDKHDHVTFTLDNGKQLRFRDPRRFGCVAAATEDELPTHRLLARLGVEPLAEECTAEYLFERSRRSKKPVKNFLMDQQVIVGVGNIYASEALFLAGVHPLRAAGRISLPRWRKLTVAVKEILQAAIQQGGTTVSDFRDSDGSRGYFQVELRVYGRAGAACMTCAAPIQRKVLAGRSTFYCPTCQT